MNEYFEESVQYTDLTKHNRKRLIYSIISNTAFAFIFIGILFAPITGQMENGQYNVLSCSHPLFIVNIIFLLIYFSVCIAVMIIFNKKKKRALTEYDYKLSSDKVVITKILNRSNRAYGAKIPYLSIYKIGNPDSETYKKISTSNGIKKYNFTINETVGEGKKTFYIASKTGEEHAVYLLQCTEKFMVQIVKHTSKDIIEEDYKKWYT